MNTTEKLPAEFKEKWIAALRSGEYKQGKDSLYNEQSDSFCCLGVAGHLCGIPKDELREDGYIGEAFDVKPNDIFPPILCRTNKVSDTASGLANMNDDGIRFPEIADWIEENL